MSLESKYLRATKIAALILGALTPLYFSIRLWDGPISTDFVLISLWHISPCVVLFILTALLEGFSSIRKVFHVNCLVAVVVLAFSVWAYSSAFNDTSSTAGLVFLFGPIWVHVLSFFLLGFSLLLMKLWPKDPLNPDKAD